MIQTKKFGRDYGVAVKDAKAKVETSKQNLDKVLDTYEHVITTSTDRKERERAKANRELARAKKFLAEAELNYFRFLNKTDDERSELEWAIEEAKKEVASAKEALKKIG